ncbi:MAG: response regulator [Magnetococcales bacterium]|nr:response regulator [Magnetococcales bacterium]MBF0439060.1 response regulator [Magnetococcales bacterium]
MVMQKNILVVDDEAELRDNLADLLKHEGFLVRTADSGRVGLHFFMAERFDVVLLDLIMPGLDGIETLQEMRKVNSQAKFIVMTAFGTINTAVQAIRKGASDYLSKPFRFDELVAVVRRSLEESHFEQRIQACDLDQTLASMANPIRRRIIEILSQSQSLRMTDISLKLGITDHTKTMFHLRILKEAGLLHQSDNKLYLLTTSGNNAFNLLCAFSSRTM